MTLVIADDGLVTVGRVESGALAAVVGRLTPVDEADCVKPAKVFDPMEPVMVLGGVDLTEPVGPLD